MHRRKVPTVDFPEIPFYLSTWYRVCTMQYLHQKEATGKWNLKNIILVSVQKAYFPLHGCKLPGFMHHCVWPTMKFAEILGYLCTWYRVCTKIIFTSKESYENVEPKNVILLYVQKAYFPLRCCKLHGFMHRHIGLTMKFATIRGNLPHGTVIALYNVYIKRKLREYRT